MRGPVRPERDCVREHGPASLEADEQLGMEAKTRRLALVLLNVVGEDVLRASVEALGDEIR